MGQEIKLIRKQFRITRQEERQIKEMMREQKVDSFSEFLRQNFSVYARKVLLNPNMSFVTINTDTYEQLVFELRRIGNNINQIAHAINQSHLISQKQLQELSKGVSELITGVEKEFQVEVKRLKEFHGSH
ncbi:MAG: MobC family plasmid mobilization relaxosome protein [Streptococcus sp.]|nr:MobC family plasmid mobilization relaxosome protein [Streptococcus sp.]